MNLKERLVRFRSFWIFPLLAIGLLSLTFRSEPGNRIRSLIWLIPVGILAWTLLEYGLHRFIFHIRAEIRNPKLREIVNASHWSHHAAPRDPNKILVHPLYGLVVSVVLFGALYVLTANPFFAAGLMTGIWAGFLYYESVHYRVHMSTSGSWLVAHQRHAHFLHHFTNHERCFGVTSPLWDYVFRTRLPLPRR